MFKVTLFFFIIFLFTFVSLLDFVKVLVLSSLKVDNCFLVLSFSELSSSFSLFVLVFLFFISCFFTSVVFLVFFLEGGFFYFIFVLFLLNFLFFVFFFLFSNSSGKEPFIPIYDPFSHPPILKFVGPSSKKEDPTPNHCYIITVQSSQSLSDFKYLGQYPQFSFFCSYHNYLVIDKFFKGIFYHHNHFLSNVISFQIYLSGFLIYSHLVKNVKVLNVSQEEFLFVFLSFVNFQFHSLHVSGVLFYSSPSPLQVCPMFWTSKMTKDGYFDQKFLSSFGVVCSFHPMEYSFMIKNLTHGWEKIDTDSEYDPEAPFFKTDSDFKEIKKELVSLHLLHKSDKNELELFFESNNKALCYSFGFSKSGLENFSMELSKGEGFKSFLSKGGSIG